METSSPSVKEGEGFPARNAWSGQADSESFAQVVKKSERKKRPLETKEGFPASKGLSNVLHKIDRNNVRLYQGLVVCLNLKTVVGAKLRSTKLVGSLDFRPGLPNFNEVIKAIENVTSLKGKIFVNVKQGHFVISALENMDAASVEKEFLNKGDELAKKLKKSFVWRNNEDAKLWGLKIRVPFEAKGVEWIQNLFAGPNSLLRHNLKEVIQIAQNCIVLVYTQIPINLVCLIAHTKGWLEISDTQARVSVWTPARPFDKVVKCPTCQINHPACLDCLFEILQKKDPSEVGNMARTEMYSINTRDPKGVKIRKQAARDGVQFNFVLPEGVPSSCAPLDNTGESMVVGPERKDQTPPKSQASKPAEGLSPIGVKKDGSNLPVCNAGGQGLVSHSPNVIPAEPTPPKGPPPVKKSHEVVPNNFKVPSSTTKGSAVQRSSSVGPVKRDAAALSKTSSFSPIRTKTFSKIKTINGSSKQVSGFSVPPILPAQRPQAQPKKKGTQTSVNTCSNPVVSSFKSASSSKETVGKSRNCVDSVIQKKENRRSQPVSSPAPIFINEEDLLVENGLVEEPDNRREVKSMLKKLNLNIKWASATEDFRRVYEELENGSIFPEDRCWVVIVGFVDFVVLLVSRNTELFCVCFPIVNNCKLFVALFCTKEVLFFGPICGRKSVNFLCSFWLLECI